MVCILPIICAYQGSKTEDVQYRAGILIAFLSFKRNQGFKPSVPSTYPNMSRVYLPFPPQWEQINTLLTQLVVNHIHFIQT